MSIKTIFLDRDGVINKEKSYLYKIEDFEFINGVFRACQHFITLGYKIIIITNQSGISRGYYTERDYLNLTQWMIDRFKANNIEILEVFHCPHSPDEYCICRKPQPGMILKAKIKYDIDIKRSWVVGDKENDIKAANNAGIKKTILVRSGHNINELNSNAAYIIDSIKNIVEVVTK